MKTRWIGVAVTALMVFTTPAWAGDDAQPMPDKRRAATLTVSAWAALGKGDALNAVRDAEAATLLQPNDAETRALLGRAYLAAGRFASADAAFRDALILDPLLARVAVSRALAQIALGQRSAARVSLASAEGHAPDADIGLALVLLGDVDDGRARLNAAAHATGADARARQNLGLVYALEGRWSDAVAVAEQDVPADLMPQRLRRWTMIAQLRANPALQVGAILGVPQAADDGQPQALALAVPSRAIPVVLADAVAPPSPPPFVALVAPVVREDNGSVVTQISFAPPPLEALAALPAAVSAAQPSLASAPQAAPAAAVIAPQIAAWAGPPLMRKSRIVRPLPAKAAAPLVAAAPKPFILASQVLLKPPRSKVAGNWAVQLGAFSSVERTEIAWGRLSGKAAFLNAYVPAGSGRRWGKAMLYRLSVSGIATRKDATSLCVRIKASGGTCFVRNARGDQPMTWALRSRADQPV